MKVDFKTGQKLEVNNIPAEIFYVDSEAGDTKNTFIKIRYTEGVAEGQEFIIKVINN